MIIGFFKIFFLSLTIDTDSLIGNVCTKVVFVLKLGPNLNQMLPFQWDETSKELTTKTPEYKWMCRIR